MTECPYPATNGGTPPPSFPQSPEQNDMWNDDFTLGGHAKQQEQPPRVTIRFYDHRATYTQSLTFGSRGKQAHKSVTGRVYQEGR
jgi:hypothetical protein